MPVAQAAHGKVISMSIMRKSAGRSCGWARGLRSFLVACWVVGVRLGAADGPEPRLTVLTSFMPLYCFAVNVAGGLATVQNLLPGNVGPHDYQPVRSDFEKIRKADLLLVNGLKLEDWVFRMVKSRKGPKALKVVEASEGFGEALIREVPALHLDDAGGHAHSHAGDANPHVWLDPQLAIRMVTNVVRAFQAADPANAHGYGSNGAVFIERLMGIDRDYRTRLASSAQVPFITYHDAFVYLAKRYQLNAVGVIETTPEVAPSIKYQGALRRLIQKSSVRVIFAEPQFPKKIAQQLSADTGVPLAFLDTLETADSKGLRPQAYEDAMRANLEVLTTHLK